MYKTNRNRQFSLSDFNQPIGLKMNPDNRWVKMAETIPWADIEKRYATNIMVYTNTNKDLVLTIASITQSNNLSIKSMNTIKNDGKYTFEIKVAVNNLEKLKKYMNDIEALEEVTGVERIIR